MPPKSTRNPPQDNETDPIMETPAATLAAADTVTVSDERIANLERQIAVLVERTTAFESENARLREQASIPSTAGPPPTDHGTHTPEHIHRPERELTTFTTSLTANNKISEPKVSQPEHYSGQRSKLSTFITQVSMVIALQGSRFPTEQSKIFYAGSFLRDTAFLWFQPYVGAHNPPAFMESFTLFCDELRRTFGDPDEERTAERQLYALRQRGSVTNYIADFMRYSVQVRWNDEAKASQFYRGLKDTIKDEFARIGRPHSLQHLQDAAIRIDNRLYERQVERGERMPSTNHSSLSNGPPNRFVPRTTSTYVKTQTTTRPAESFRFVNQTNNNTYTRKGKLTPAEYQRRKDNNLCLYCGEQGHQVLKCPQAPSKKTSGFRAAFEVKPHGSSGNQPVKA